MGTPAAIFYENENGTFNGSFCSSDGYIGEGLGLYLFSHFNSLEKAKELVSHGEICTIGRSIEKMEFYSRDKGEALKTMDNFTRQRAIEEGSYYSYAYIFQNGAWWVYQEGSEEGMLLSEALKWISLQASA